MKSIYNKIRFASVITKPLSFAKTLVLALTVLASSTVAQPALAEIHHVTLETSLGNIVLELDDSRAPATVDNFLSYVDDGFYDQTIFHRVIEGFMVQGGGFTSTYQKKPTRPPITNEANNGLSNNRYTIAMARTNSPHSATAQFFINTVDNRNLDHTSATPRGWGYTVFGRVIEGAEVVQSISEVPTGAGGPFRSDVPRESIAIISAFRLGEQNDETLENAADDSAQGEDALEPAIGASEADSEADQLEQQTSLESD